MTLSRVFFGIDSFALNDTRFSFFILKRFPLIVVNDDNKRLFIEIIFCFLRTKKKRKIDKIKVV